MSRQWRKITSNQRGLAMLIIFGIAFGYVEATVVYYLRILLKLHTQFPIAHYKTLLNLGFITFVSSSRTFLISRHVADAEVARETATIIMLLCVAYVSGRSLRQRFGSFLVTFACWDITYYVFLRVLDNWPGSLMTKDIFFLIPVTWIGPVITPLIISAMMLIMGIRLYVLPSKGSRLWSSNEFRSR